MTIPLAMPLAGRKARVLVVGECPAPSWDGQVRTILAGLPFRRLAERVLWPGAPDAWQRYLLTCARANVIFGPVSGSWPGREARRNGRDLEKLLVACRLPAIILGRRAAVAMGHVREVPIPSQVDVGGLPRLLLPHPSGRCRKWNDPETLPESRALAAAFWAAVGYNTA